jgi:hypothetical protein
MHALVWAVSGSTAAQTAAPRLVAPDEPLPTRFVLCHREVQGMAGERQALMRTCLARRLEGERLVERQCRGQVAGVRGVAARQTAQRACERDALAVVSTELPRRPPRPPRVVAQPGVTERDGGLPDRPAWLDSPPSRRPATGEQ